MIPLRDGRRLVGALVVLVFAACNATLGIEDERTAVRGWRGCYRGCDKLSRDCTACISDYHTTVCRRGVFGSALVEELGGGYVGCADSGGGTVECSRCEFCIEQCVCLLREAGLSETVDEYECLEACSEERALSEDERDPNGLTAAQVCAVSGQRAKPRAAFETLLGASRDAGRGGAGPGAGGASGTAGTGGG